MARKPTMGMPPRKAEAAGSPPADETKVQAFIGRGGTPADGEPTAPPAAAMKNINIKLLAGELEQINRLRARRGTSRSGRKLGISLHDWIVEAVQEKIARESRKEKK